MDDLISRKAAQAIKILPKCYREYKTGNLDDAYEQGWEDAMFSLNALPTIEPKKGKWIDYKGYTVCSVCAENSEKQDYYVKGYRSNYCPNCGAHMDK